MTTVVRVTRRKFTLYIGREWQYLPESKWHNPYRIGKDGDRATVLLKYEQHVRSRPDLMAALHEIDDQVLGCHCRPDDCHGDVLILLRKEQLSDERYRLHGWSVQDFQSGSVRLRLCGVQREG